MAGGGGRYEKEVEELREKTKARGIILLVFGGDRGEGFEVQADVQVLIRLPSILRDLANQIETDVRSASEMAKARHEQPASQGKDVSRETVES